MTVAIGSALIVTSVKAIEAEKNPRHSDRKMPRLRLFPKRDFFRFAPMVKISSIIVHVLPHSKHITDLQARYCALPHLYG